MYQEFKLDQEFMNIDTDYKTIGLREIDFKPDVFTIAVHIWTRKNNGYTNVIDPNNPGHEAIPPGAPGNAGTTTIPTGEPKYLKKATLGWEIKATQIEITITPSNTLEEILTNAFYQFNTKKPLFPLEFIYLPDTYELEIWTEAIDSTVGQDIKEEPKFKFLIYLLSKERYYQNFSNS
jgi:hypothetical protein